MALTRLPDRGVGAVAADGPPPPTAAAPPRWRAHRHALAERTRSVLGPLWRDRRLGLVATVGAASLWGLVAGWWTPRGPLTSGEALAAMAIGLLVGLVGGLALRSRWAMALGPLAFVVVFELVRLGLEGPTVDAPHWSTYGLIALTVGRGFHGLVGLLPVVLGGAIGAGTARRLRGGAPTDGGRRRATRLLRRGVAVATSLLLVLVAAALARPATTDPIVDGDGEPIAGSIAELTTVDVGGHELGLMLRGHDADAPVLLFLAGGPGGSERGAMRRHLASLEEHFVVATWDQRGTGASYAALDPTSTLTVEGAVDDAIAVTELLTDRFDEEQVYVLGQSWGTLLGVLAVQQRPDLYAGYVGTGQMVSPVETDRIIYEDTLSWARAEGDDALVDTLEANGPPPYESILDYEPALGNEQEVYPYDHSANSEGEGQFSENLFVEEYALIDQVHALGAFLDTFTALYPQLQQLDLRTDAPSLEVPVYLVQGAHEADGRAVPAEEWFADLEAPDKGLVELDTSGHRPLFEQPERFTEVITELLGVAPAPAPAPGG